MRLREWFGLSDSPRLEDARWLGPLVFVVLCVVVGSLLGLVLFRSFEALATGAGDLRSYLYFLVALVGLPFLIWRTKVAQDQVRVSEQGQFTDRFSKAVEQLGAEKTVFEDGEQITKINIEVRLGAIYSLGELAAADPNIADKICTMLATYVRLHANRRHEEARSFYDERHIIKAAMVTISNAGVIVRRMGDLGKRHDLRRIRLNKMEFHELDLRGFDLSDSEITKCEFRNSDLSSASFCNTDLEGSRFLSSTLQMADFRHSKFGTDRGVVIHSFIRCDLTGADITGADWPNISFSGKELAVIYGSSDTMVRLRSPERPAHWSEFTASDGATRYCYRQFLDSLTLPPPA